MLWNHLSTLHNAMEATVTIQFCRSAIFGYGPKSGIADVPSNFPPIVYGVEKQGRGAVHVHVLVLQDEDS